MSVGGRVVEVVPVSESKWWVNTDDSQPPRRPNLCAVYVNPKGFHIQPGDSLWWQGGECFWTPKHRQTFGASDIPLPKIGFSGVGRPKKATGGSHD